MAVYFPTLIATDKKQNLEAYSVWDEAAQVYELFTDPNGKGYIGCADTRAEALKVAREWFADRASY
jgi:hypothetical protein